jgi:hypothetical protein
LLLVDAVLLPDDDDDEFVGDEDRDRHGHGTIYAMQYN